MIEPVGLHGYVEWEVWNDSGILVRGGKAKNLVTQVGDQAYGERAAGISGAVGLVTCIKFGTGATAAAKTGAGAALVSYLTGSNHAFDGTWPQSVLNGASRQIQFKATYSPGQATSGTPITEAALCITNADATSAASDIWARAIIAPGSKAAGDTFIITWNHLILGA